MKKIFTFICAVLICICPLLFTACGSNDTSLNASRYFESKVIYNVYDKTGDIEDKLSTFTDNKFDNLTQYSKIKFTCVSDWLYKMTISKITFDLYSNQTEELQFVIRFSNLKNGDTKDGDPKFVVTVPAVKGKAVSVSVPIGDYVESYSETTTVSIEIDNADMFFKANGENTGLKFDISNVRFYGKHDLSKIGK